MKYFYVEPEIAGSLGSRTLMDRSVYPPILKRLHYQIEGWLGDTLLESFPAFIIAETARSSLQAIAATGAAFDDNLEVSVSARFRELYPDRKLPTFAWLKAVGKAGQDDIGIAADGRLVLSQRALDGLGDGGIAHASIELFEDAG